MCFKKMEKKIKNLKLCDISMIKLATAAFILMIVALWPPLASLNWYWYLIIGVLASIKPMMVFFKK